MADIDDRRHWHLDKKVNLSHMVATLGLAFALFTWANTVERRIDANSLGIIHSKELVELENRNVKAAVNRVDAKVDQVNDKLDKLIEANSSYPTRGK
jgi:hypothetical protein